MVFLWLVVLLAVVAVWTMMSTERFEDMVRAAVVGGHDAVSGRYPWFVAIYYALSDGSTKLACGGFLIAPDVVLTAAHCTKVSSGRVAYVAIGKSNRLDNKGAEVRRPKAIVWHSSFQSNYRNDIALILLDRPSTHAPVKILTQPARLPAQLSVIGFGQARPTGSRDEDERKVQLQEVLLDVRACEALFKADRTQSYPGVICAGSVGESACFGDSGGPLFIKGRTPSEDVVVGTTSWGKSCGLGVPSAWTSLAYFADWIATAKKQLREPMVTGRANFEPRDLESAPSTEYAPSTTSPISNRNP